MVLEIKTSALEPVRNVYANLERRFGDKAASRYQEATYDLQSVVNFHYRPLWQPQHELNDRARTAIVMSDWYDFKDPRQFYYGAYVQNRAKMQEIAESDFAYFDKRGLKDNLSPEVCDYLIQRLLPLRHAESTANLNNMYGCAFGFGTAITQALLYNAMDRLGIAQYLSRIGLLLDHNSGSSLAAAKDSWLHAAEWQGLRALCEQMTVVQDWFEVVLAQNLVLDTLVFDLFYRQMDDKLVADGARDVALLTDFMRSWNKDICRWFDAVVKTAAAESDANRTQLNQWIADWRARAAEALAPIASAALGDDALAQALAALDTRVSKLGLGA